MCGAEKGTDEYGQSPRRVRRTLGPLDGAQIPGGCDHCDAYQEVVPVSAGVWSINVHHDEWCPFLQNRQAEPGETDAEGPDMSTVIPAAPG